MPITERIIFRFFKKPVWILAACLGALAVLSALGLDFINSKKGEAAYFFAARIIKPESAPILQEEMRKKEEAGRELPPKPEEKKEAEKAEQHVPPIEFPVQTQPPPPENQPAFPASPELKKKKGKVALIVDDMGNSLQVIEDLSSIGLPLTIAVLPRSQWAAETARIARSHGLEVILHLPLESLNDHESNEVTEGLIHSMMSEQEILAALEDNLQRVPFINGVNNHMGSKITADRRLMLPILEKLKEKKLFFVDSVTSGNSIAYQLALELDIPAAQRHIFLDNDPSEESIRKNLFQLFRLAQRRGTAVGICHPLETTVKVLTESLAGIRDYTCEAVFVSEIVH